MNPLNISTNGRNLLNRRSFLSQTGGVFGSLWTHEPSWSAKSISWLR